MRTTHLRYKRGLLPAFIVLIALAPAVASMRSVAARQAFGSLWLALAGEAMVDAPLTNEASPADGTPLWQGQEITYTITVTNDLNADTTFAPNRLRLRDAIPANSTYVDGSLKVLQQPGGGSSDWTCSYDSAGTRIDCLTPTGGILRPSSVLKLEFKVRVNDNVPYGTVLTNVAHFYNEEESGVGTITNSSNTTNHPVTAPADLTLSKLSAPVVSVGSLPVVALPVVGPNVPAGSVNSGGYIRYDLPFGNGGPASADNTMIIDQLPANTEYVGALGAGGSFIAASSSRVFTIVAVDTAAPLGPNVSLTCTLTGEAGSQAIYCLPKGNSGLTPAYLDGTLPAGYGGTLTFFVRVNESITGGTVVSNPARIASGLCPATGATLFPPVSCTGTPDANPANNVTPATQNLVVASSNLSVTKVVQYAVTAATSPYETGPIAPETPPNGTATTGTAVLAGTYLTYRVTVTNNGPSDVANIRLTDLLPSGLEDPPNRVLGAKFIAVAPVVPSGVTFLCAPPVGVNTSNNPQMNGGTVVCTAPLLAATAPNNTAAVDITVLIDPSTRNNLVSSSTIDATISNLNRPVSGTATLTTPVAAVSDLVLTKTHTSGAGVVGGPVTAGTDFTYLLSVTNNGVSLARSVQLVDTLPAFQTVKKIEVGGIDDNGVFVTPNTKDGNLNPTVVCTKADSGGWTTSVTCTATELPANRQPDGTLNPAGSFAVRLTVTQDQRTVQPVPVSYQNCATLTSTSIDPASANSTSICDTVDIEFLADTAGTIAVSPEPVTAGELLTYTLTASNAGPSAAFNTQINQTLPLGTIFVSATASAGATLQTPAVNAHGTITATWDSAGGTDSIAGGTADGLTTIGTIRTLTIVARICSDFQQVRGLSDAQMCTTNLISNAEVTSDTFDPSVSNNSLAFSSTVQVRANVQVTQTGPAEVPYTTTLITSYINYTLNFQNNGSSNSAGTKIVNVLPKGISLTSWNSTVAGTTIVVTESGGVQTLTFTIGVLSPVAGNPDGAIQCSSTFPSSGTITIKAKVEITYPVVGVTNTATISSTNCLADPNPANNVAVLVVEITGPGLTDAASYPATSESAGQQPGSILFYPIYTSDAVTPSRQDTKIIMTNVSPTEKVTVHIFAVDGASCSVLDYFICLTPAQTWTYYASDFDPGNSGYIMAVAVDYATGLPRAYNQLIGSEYVKFSTGHAATLSALAVQAVSIFPAGLDPTPVALDLKFDNLSYSRLPQVVAVDSIASTDNRNSTMLVLNRIGGDMTSAAAGIGNISGLVFDDQEIAYSYTRTIGSCQLREVFSNSFPRTFTPINKVIPSGRSGWMKIWTTGAETKALFGSVINYNATTASNPSSYNQGHNLHTMTVTQSPITVRIPLTQPTCN